MARRTTASRLWLDFGSGLMLQEKNKFRRAGRALVIAVALIALSGCVYVGPRPVYWGPHPCWRCY